LLEEYIKERLQSRPLLLMAHAVAGYPSLEDNWAMLECMQDAGIDLVELQLPFSEPVADGPAFIRANQAALDRGLHWQDYFDFVSRATQAFDFHVLFMGYYNSVFCMGHRAFCEKLESAGASGFIIADLPVENSSSLDILAQEFSLAHVYTVTPLNSQQRLHQITENASGFLYCVARTGVTGRATDLDTGLHEYIKRCRAVTRLPLALGFGIKKADQIRQLTGTADIAIIGTACLETWEQMGASGYRQFLHDLVSAAGD